MPEDAPRPAQAAIRTALGAIFGRVTVAEGFPDQPVSVRHEGPYKGMVSRPSLHRMAER